MGKYAWGVKAKHCRALSTNFWKKKVLLTSPSNCLITKSKLSRQWFEFSVNVKVMGSNPCYLFKSFLLYLVEKNLFGSTVFWKDSCQISSNCISDYSNTYVLHFVEKKVEKHTKFTFFHPMLFLFLFSNCSIKNKIWHGVPSASPLA